MESKLKLRPGTQNRLARKSGIPQSTVSCIFSGKRRATPEQATALEPLLAAEGIFVSRFEMAFCPKGTPLLSLARN
jgi:transcriptional regulator with XRE-family HTH domain